MIRNGFYIIKDSFFSDMSDPYLKGNKKQNRPHYYCFEDSNYNGIYWMIPLSSRIDKYKKMLTWKSKFQCRGKFHHALKFFDFLEL